MKKISYLLLFALIASSCTHNVYDMNVGTAKIAKNASYRVEYIADIPAGTTANISYTDKNNATHNEKLYKGKLDDTIDLPSGSEVEFAVDVKLATTGRAGKVITAIKVDGETINSQTQSGKNIEYRFKFRLP
jgi:hypothetical protein